MGDKLESKISAVENSAVGCSWISITITSSHGLPWGLKMPVSVHNCLCFWAQATTRKSCDGDLGVFFVSPIHQSLSVFPSSLDVQRGLGVTQKGWKRVTGAVGRFYTEVRVVRNLKKREKNVWLTLSWDQSSTEGLFSMLWWSVHLWYKELWYGLLHSAPLPSLPQSVFLLWKRLSAEHLFSSNIIDISLEKHCFL